jgi:hypothetical protein
MRRFRFRPLTVAGGAAAVTGALAVTALAVPIVPDESTRTPGASLTQVGPTAEHGFPAWYRDSNGIRLEACTTLDDPLCSTLPDEVPDPDAPVSYPDNFPGEFFYQLAGAAVTGNGVDMTVGMDLEGAWANEEVVDGDQMVFGRIRIRDKGIADGKYRVTHPYGADEFVADGNGINYTQDIGTTPGVFGQALSSRVGPFLTWDPAVAPAAPAGYVGDPGVSHKVVGSPYGTNFVKVERINDDGSRTELARTEEFEIQGRKASNSGLNIDKATYSVGADGKGVTDVYASSDADQSLQVKDAGIGFIQTRMRGSKGKYFAHLPVSSSPEGKSVSVINAGDAPVAEKTLRLVDVVSVSKAVYDADADTLTVSASSSDQDSTPGKLTVLGTSVDANGIAEIKDVVAPPATVTVTSDKGGSTTVPITTSGATFVSDKPEAAAFASPIAAAPSQKVTLTGTGSTGTITSYEWKQVPAFKAGDVEIGKDENGDPIMGPGEVEVPVTDANRVTITGASASVATFNAPAADGPIAFELVVSGPAGTSDPVKVQVDVATPEPDPGTGEPAAPIAKAGDDRTVRRDTVVNLDGSTSTLADEYKWERVSGPAVTITGATTAKPSFRFPLMPLPTSTASTGNPTYKVDAEPVVLKLTVTGQGKTATDEVTIKPQTETLTITAAEYRPGTEWRVSGTSSILAGQRVAVVMGNALTGRVLGFANVDAVGGFSFRGAGAVAPPTTTTTVSAVSAQGDDHTGFVFRRR